MLPPPWVVVFVRAGARGPQTTRPASTDIPPTGSAAAASAAGDRAFQALLADPAPSGDLISGLRTARYAHPDVTEALRRGRAFTRLLVVKCELTTPLGSVDVVALIVGLCD